MSDTWNNAPLAAPKAPTSSWDSAPLAGPSTQQKAVVSANDNPEEAAKALSIGKKTSIPPTVVQSDLPGYDAHMKRQEAIKYVDSNPAIAKYVDGNPMAAKVSGDDYEHLNKVSKTVQALDPKYVKRTAQAQVVNSIPELVEAMSTAPGREKLLNSIMGLPKTLYEDVTETTKAGVEGSLKSLMSHGARAEQPYIWNGPKGPPTPSPGFWEGFIGQFKDTASVGAGAVGLAMSPFLPVMGAAKTAIARPLAILENMPLEDTTADVDKALFALSPRGGLKAPPRPTGTPTDFDGFMSELRGKQTRAEIDEFLRKKAEGDGPPGAVLQIEHAKVAEEGLTKAVEVAQESKTKARSPELFEEAVAAHGDGEVHISGERIVELYQKAGKTPAEGDGLFGFVPDIAARAADAAATGGEVTIPVSKYIAHVDPTVHEGLKGDVRLHEAPTTEEAKEIQKEVQAFDPNSDVPPPAKDMIRFYHGTVFEDASSFSGKTFVTTSFNYARDYHGGPNNVLYADMSKEEAIQRGLWDEVNEKPWSTGSIEDGSAILKPLKKNKIASPEAEQAKPIIEQKKKLGLNTDVFMNMMLEKGESLGITENEFKAYSDKVARQEQAILDRAVAQGRKEAGRYLTPEWKRNEAKVRDEVTTELREQGAFAAEKYLRENKITLGGDNIDVIADQLAPLFGFETGDEMRAALDVLEVEQAASGKSPQRQLPDAIKAETARRMEERYGNLAENIAKEAREIALADHTFDVLADEVRLLAKASGGTSPLGRNEMVSWAKQSFERSNIVEAGNWEKHRRAVEKNGREAEKALLKSDFQEAFMWKQRQFLAATVARESTALQKVIDNAEKKIDRFSTEEVIEGISQPYLEQLRQVLASVGLPQHFAPLADTGALRDFVAEHEGQIAVAPWLMDGSQPKLQDMSVAQFRDFVNSIKSIEHVGRQAEKLFSAQKEAELVNVVGDIVKELERFPFIHQPQNPTVGQQARSLGRRAVGLHLLVERALDYTDQFNPHGPMTEWLDRPLRDANTKEIVLTERATKQLRDLRDYTDSSISEKIPNTLFRDANDKTGFLSMTRMNLRMLMLNTGNWSNLEKLSKGFGVNEADVRRFIDQHATAKDVAWVNGIWKVFKDLKPEADAVQLRDTGVPVDTIEAVPWEVKGGKLEGGYYPLTYDKYNSDINARQAPPLFDKGYMHSATPHRYTLERTDYAAPIDLSGFAMQSKIQGMIHDIAFREAVRNANRLISNQEFRTAVSQYWGKEVADLLPGWLRDISNSHNFDETYARDFVYAATLVRQNIINTLIGMNPGTFLKHGGTAAIMSADRVGFMALASAIKEIGLSGLFRNLKGLAKREDYLPDEAFMDEFRNALDTGQKGENARQFVMDSSAVMRNRQRQWEDSIRGALDAITKAGPGKAFADLRQLSAQYGRLAVAWSDQATAFPTWLAAYKKAYLGGETHADAVFIADKEVSRAHGSNFVGDQPVITRLGNTGPAEFMKWFTSLYRFWNHNQNNQFQLAWDVAAAARGGPPPPPPGQLPPPGVGTPMGPEPNANAWSISRRVGYMMAIIAIEELAGPAKDEDGRGPLTHMLMASLRYFGGGWVGVREITNSMAHGYEPSTGLVGTMLKTGYDSLKDLQKSTGHRAGVAKDAIKHTVNTIGFLTGVGYGQAGRTGQFLVNVARGQERPSSLADWRQGLRTGSSKARRHK